MDRDSEYADDETRHRRRLYDPALADASVRLRGLEDRMTALEERTRQIEEENRTALAVQKALAAQRKSAWTDRQRFVTIGAAILGGAGTVVSTYIAFGGGGH